MSSPLMTAQELAAELNVPVSFIYDRTRKNGPDEIPHLKLGKYVRFDRAQIEKWKTDQERGQ